LSERGAFENSTVVADIGSGTGLLTELLLDGGARVYAVEPNPAMRHAAEQRLDHRPRFSSVAGCAEDTTLHENAIDLVTAGQAFHWFDVEAARREFVRILRTDGWVLLVWNARAVDRSPFARDYESLLLEHCPSYREIPGRGQGTDRLERLFERWDEATLDNAQVFDFEGLRGRLASSSFALRPHDRGYAELISALFELFERHQKDGRVEFVYDTRLYLGQPQHD
jgi:SAM-dependent methyltransferase